MATNGWHVALTLVYTPEELLERFGETLMGVNVGASDSTGMSGQGPPNLPQSRFLLIACNSVISCVLSFP